MKTVTVSVQIQLDIDNNDILIGSQEAIDFINGVLSRNSYDCYNAQIFNVTNYSDILEKEEQKGEFVNDGSDYQVFDYVFSTVLSAVKGFTNIEVRDYDDNLVYEIAGVEMIDEDCELQEILDFEDIVKALLIGEGLL